MKDLFEILHVEEERWAPLIGRLILIHTNIEDILKSLSKDHYEMHCMSKDEWTRLKCLFLSRGELLLSADQVDNIREVIKRMENVRELRNLICHNPVSLSTKYDRNGKLIITLQISSSRKNVSITYSSFSKRVSEARVVYAELNNIVAKLYSAASINSV